MQNNKRIIRVLIVVSFMFLALVTYLLHFNMFRADDIASNAYNKRQWDDEKYVKRGSVYDRDGVLLAETVIDGDTHTRKYPKGNLYSHIIGYCSQVYGKSQLEMKYDKELLGYGDINITFNEIRSGYDLNLTIDNDLQQYAYNQLSKRRGAIVALEPSTGRVLAMVSYPDFDPNAESLEKNWKYIVEREDSPLLARATSGLYAPGSTYKIVTAATAYDLGHKERLFDDKGAFEEGGLNVENYGAKSYGQIGLKRAFEVSSNAVFCSLGYEMGAEKVLFAAESFGVNKELSLDVQSAKSRIDYKKMNNADAALVSIGQGQLLMTPLNAAMISATVANGGKMMKPYLVESVTAASGAKMMQARPSEYLTPISSETADYIKELMVGVVENGTGSGAKIYGTSVAGKTGTAENETDKDHAWFVGFAPADNPQIAVAVILEYDGGAGGSNAAPIARNIMNRYIKN